MSIALDIYPVHLGVLTALAVEMEGHPAGRSNLFATSGTTGVPVTRVMRGSIPFLVTDGRVLMLALWIPGMAVKSVFG